MASPRPLTLDDLRRHALACSLFKPTTLPQAWRRLGFVQARRRHSTRWST